MRTITKLFLSSMLLVNGTMALAHSDGGFVDKDFFKGMKKDDKAAILMVHFGTTFDDTRALTIDRINEKVKKEFKNITDYYLSLGDGQLNRLMRYLRYEQADKFIKEYKDILYDTKLS